MPGSDESLGNNRSNGQLTACQPAWVLDSMLLGPLRRHRPLASVILGLGGPLAFAVLSCALLGLMIDWMSSGQLSGPGEILLAFVLFMLASGCYLASLLVLHLIASCQLPISVRLAMIYATIFACLTAALWPTGEAIGGGNVVGMLPLCLGGFIARRIRGWRAVAWNQPVTANRLTIAWLLDVTAAIAITLGLISREADLGDPGGWLCVLPSLLLFAVLGMHVWVRLLSICPDQRHAGSGFGIWMAINVLWAFLVFVGFAVNLPDSPVGLLGFLGAPCWLLVAHVWTEIPIRWLRGCGWTMVRAGV